MVYRLSPELRSRVKKGEQFRVTLTSFRAILKLAKERGLFVRTIETKDGMIEFFLTDQA